MLRTFVAPYGVLHGALKTTARPLCTQLPDVTPAMLAAAASVKRLFSGDLASPVKTFPASPGGTEAHYLRAQLGRISVATAIAPAGYYAAVEQEEVEVPEGEVRFGAGQGGPERFRTVIRRSEPL